MADPAPKYKVGDKVALRSDLVDGNQYIKNQITYRSQKGFMPGDTVTISEHKGFSVENYYGVKECGHLLGEDMIEDYSSPGTLHLALLG